MKTAFFSVPILALSMALLRADDAQLKNEPEAAAGGYACPGADHTQPYCEK